MATKFDQTRFVKEFLADAVCRGILEAGTADNVRDKIRRDVSDYFFYFDNTLVEQIYGKVIDQWTIELFPAKT